MTLPTSGSAVIMTDTSGTAVVMMDTIGSAVVMMKTAYHWVCRSNGVAYH